MGLSNGAYEIWPGGGGVEMGVGEGLGKGWGGVEERSGLAFFLCFESPV